MGSIVCTKCGKKDSTFWRSVAGSRISDIDRTIYLCGDCRKKVEEERKAKAIELAKVKLKEELRTGLKDCPYCLEKINLNALRCSKCGALLDEGLKDKRENQFTEILENIKTVHRRLSFVIFLIILLVVLFFVCSTYLCSSFSDTFKSLR